MQNERLAILLENKEYEEALVNYKKSLKLNKQNAGAEIQIQKIEQLMK